VVVDTAMLIEVVVAGVVVAAPKTLAAAKLIQHTVIRRTGNMLLL